MTFKSISLFRAMDNFTIGGVPEHFNLPWHLSIEAGEFKKAGINLKWKDYYGGTGAMTKALRSGELDIAVVLTEGIISDIIKGSPARIIQFYIMTPLIWGIHVGRKSAFKEVEDLRGKRFSISRFGSGSHLISIVNALQLGWSTNALHFELVGNLEGALEALTNGTADALLWEKFMTQPHVNRGVLRRVGICKPPWPCFAIAVRENLLLQKPEAFAKLGRIIAEAGAAFMNNPDAIELVANRYGLRKANAKEWYQQTTWATSNQINKQQLVNVMNSLKGTGIIEEGTDPAALCWSEANLV